MFGSYEGGIILIIIGIVLIVIGKAINEATISKILYYGGVIALIVGIIMFLVNVVTMLS